MITISNKNKASSALMYFAIGLSMSYGVFDVVGKIFTALGVAPLPVACIKLVALVGSLIVINKNMRIVDWRPDDVTEN